jgi:hypothetical protein
MFDTGRRLLLFCDVPSNTAFGEAAAVKHILNDFPDLQLAPDGHL